MCGINLFGKGHNDRFFKSYAVWMLSPRYLAMYSFGGKLRGLEEKKVCSHRLNAWLQATSQSESACELHLKCWRRRGVARRRHHCSSWSWCICAEKLKDYKLLTSPQSQGTLKQVQVMILIQKSWRLHWRSAFLKPGMWLWWPFNLCVSTWWSLEGCRPAA